MGINAYTSLCLSRSPFPAASYRFVISENINSSGISLFAIFDGHGGEYAAEYAKTVLIKNIHQKLMQSSAIADGKELPGSPKAAVCAEDDRKQKEEEKEEKEDDKQEQEVNERYKVSAHNGNNDPSGAVQRRQSFRKSKTEDTVGTGNNGAANGGGGGGAAANNNQMLENDLLSKYMGNQSPARQQVKKNLLNGTSGGGESVPAKPKTYDARCYVQNGSINFGKIITDEVLAADYDLVEAAKKMVSQKGLFIISHFLFVERMD